MSDADRTLGLQAARQSGRKSMRELRPPEAGEVERKSRLFARLVSALLEPIFYWLDLFGQDDQPSNTKVIATAAVLTGLAVVLTLGLGMARRGTTPDEWYVVLVLGVIGGAAGWDTFKALAKLRGNGAHRSVEPPA